jgi:hypothetical protein
MEPLIIIMEPQAMLQILQPKVALVLAEQIALINVQVVTVLVKAAVLGHLLAPHLAVALVVLHVKIIVPLIVREVVNLDVQELVKILVLVNVLVLVRQNVTMDVFQLQQCYHIET